MLKLLTEDNIDLVLDLGKNTVLGTRIICYALCYGFKTSFIDFWAGDNVLISRFDDTFTIVTSLDSDLDELGEFIEIIGAKSIVTTEEIAQRLGFSYAEIKSAFRYKSQHDITHDAIDISDDKMKEAYSLISASIPDSFKADKNSYLSFLSDLKYRESRGFARRKCFEINSQVIATAITASETNDSAIISAVTCKEEYRRFGYGKGIVLSLAEALKKEGKEVYVIALNDSAKGFYMHIGFEEIEKIAYISEKV